MLLCAMILAFYSCILVMVGVEPSTRAMSPNHPAWHIAVMSSINADIPDDHPLPTSNNFGPPKHSAYILM